MLQLHAAESGNDVSICAAGGGRRDAAKLTVRDNLEDSIVCVEGVLLGEMETTSW
jgi:hypothetical protein